MVLVGAGRATSGGVRRGLGGGEATRYGLALHRPGKAGARRDDVDRDKGGGGQAADVAESATSIEDVLKGIIGKPTEKSKVVIERAPVQHFADAVLSTSAIYHSPEAAKEAGFSAIPA